MCDYIGQKVSVKTPTGTRHGRLTSFDKDSGKITLEDSYHISNELSIADILDVQLSDSTTTAVESVEDEKGLKEEDMYRLFYDAFNIYGPFEDSFCSNIAYSLRKFIRDLPKTKIRIVVGSDDIFGRIGLSMARMLLDRTERLVVECPCAVVDLRTQRYLNAFLNSGGIITDELVLSENNITIFACSRKFNFSRYLQSAGQIILLDIPSVSVFPSFVGVGLGFRPENYLVCQRHFYQIDVGFGNILCSKYKLCNKYKNNLMRVDITDK
ncbi:hypothetical protein PAEPH01_1324 [Pancytospora epiphaga]|nr:hypothetical protein PAEPH01_1324 [Pancytospora epiphaga]